jgi:phosphoglycolate phosphatase-like HAD superfamily hydrolase
MRKQHQRETSSCVVCGVPADGWGHAAAAAAAAAVSFAISNAGGVRASFHVGDTPMDVQAALAANCVAVGVTTGVYTRQQLQECGEGAAAGSVVVLDGLEDLEQVLKVLQLE